MMYVDAAAACIRARGGQVECGRSVAGLLVQGGELPAACDFPVARKLRRRAC